MYNDFLNNEESYFQLENFWDAFFIEIISGRENDWVMHYYNTCYSNGAKFMNGNPIFSAKSKVDGKSIKIIQELPEDLDEIQYWVDNKEKNELVIIFSFSDDNLSRVKEIINKWVCGFDF